MASRNGCAVEGPSTWSRAVFANLDCLPQSEQARWCVWKSAELLYLLSAPEGNALNVLPVPALDREVVRVLGKTRRYMEDHLADPLTIPALSRMAMLSATTFKDAFRRLYGLPVHAWLRQRRMERAAELLLRTDKKIIQIAEEVGYHDMDYFVNRFIQVKGCTPARFRRQMQSGE